MGIEQEINQDTFADIYQKALINLMYTYGCISSIQKDFFKEYNLTTQQYNILRILRGAYPEKLTVTTIKKRMLDKMCDASRLIDRLIAKNLAAKEYQEEDKRASYIQISHQGLEILQTIDPEIKSLNHLFSKLNKEEAQELNRLLDKIRTKFNQ